VLLQVRALEKLSGIFAVAGQALSRERLVLATYDGPQDDSCAVEDAVSKMTSAVHAGEDDMASLTSFRGIDIVHRPRLLLWGRQGDAQGHISRAILQALDPLPIFSIGLQALYTSTGSVFLLPLLRNKCLVRESVYLCACE
jgi:hypothetical protein